MFWQAGVYQQNGKALQGVFRWQVSPDAFHEGHLQGGDSQPIRSCPETGGEEVAPETGGKGLNREGGILFLLVALMAGYFEWRRFIAECLETSRVKTGRKYAFLHAKRLFWYTPCFFFQAKTAPFWAAYGRVEGEKHLIITKVQHLAGVNSGRIGAVW
jgi:hypothetical protein